MTWIFVKRLPLESDLSELSRFLRDRGLEHRIIESHGTQVVEVRDEPAVEPLSRLIDEYLAGSVDLPDSVPQREPVQVGLSPWQTPITLLIIALSIIGCLIVETAIGQSWLSWFTFQDYDGYQPLPLSEGIFAGQFWRLVTPAFLHFGFFHLLFNSLWLWDLGRRLELGVGRSHYLMFVVASAVVSNIAQHIWGGSGLFGGMSGVVYALVGFIWLRQYSDPNPLFAVPKAVIGFMLFWLVLCMSGVVDYFIAGSVANAAHVGGLLAGMAWGAISARKNTRNR